MKAVLAALVLLSVAVASDLVGQEDDEASRQTLAGLPGVRVVVEEVGEEAQGAGLLTSQIQTDVELKLRQAGIAVLPYEEAGTPWTTGGAYLYVRVTVLQNSAIDLYAFSSEVTLRQTVNLTRTSTHAVVWATTWEAKGEVGTSGQLYLSSFVRDNIRDLTDQFANAYLAANPKR